MKLNSPVMICEASPPVWRRVLKILKDCDIFHWNKELDINVKPTSIDSLGTDLLELCDAVNIFLRQYLKSFKSLSEILPTTKSDFKRIAAFKLSI